MTDDFCAIFDSIQVLMPLIDDNVAMAVASPALVEPEIELPIDNVVDGIAGLMVNNDVDIQPVVDGNEQQPHQQLQQLQQSQQAQQVQNVLDQHGE